MHEYGNDGRALGLFRPGEPEQQNSLARSAAAVTGRRAREGAEEEERCP